MSAVLHSNILKVQIAQEGLIAGQHMISNSCVVFRECVKLLHAGAACF